MTSEDRQASLKTIRFLIRHREDQIDSSIAMAQFAERELDRLRRDLHKLQQDCPHPNMAPLETEPKSDIVGCSDCGLVKTRTD